MSRVAAAAGINIIEDPTVAFAEFSTIRSALSKDSKNRGDGYSSATAQKFASILATTIPINPKTGQPLSADPLFQLVKRANKAGLDKPTKFDMQHTVDISYVMDWYDRGGTDEVIPLADATAVLNQKRFCFAMMHLNCNQPSDLCHILREGTHVTADTFTVRFSSLKKRDGTQEIEFPTNRDLPTYREPSYLLAVLLSNYHTVAPVEKRGSVPHLLLCKSSDAQRLVPKNPLPQTLCSWLKKDLTAMGYPEINPYSLVKACATENEAMLAKDFDRDGNAIRWKSKRVMYSHYKSDARVWSPMHLREDKDELKSELSESEHFFARSLLLSFQTLWEVARADFAIRYN